MATFKVHKKSGYTVLSNTPIREKNMSLKAKGLLWLMLSLPEDWDYSIPGLCAICKENQSAIESALKELKQFGYLIVEKKYPNQTESGRIEYIYNVYEEPVSENQDDSSEDFEQGGKQEQAPGFLGVENPGLNKYKDNQNTTHVSSKDDTLEYKGRSQSSARSETQSSGKLFSSGKSQTRKSSVQKTNTFITSCQREAIKKEFSQEVLTELDKYFRMLAEMNTLLPAVSIAEQLAHLARVPKERQVTVVKNTISRGWKSLQYEAESIMTSGNRGSSFVDTASPDTFKATPEADKNGDWKKEIPAENIF